MSGDRREALQFLVSSPEGLALLKACEDIASVRLLICSRSNGDMPLAHTMATLWAQKGRDGKPSQHQVLRKAKTKDGVPWNLSYFFWNISSAFCVFPVTRSNKYT